MNRGEGDKRKVSTDALETLGNIIDEHEKRDAIHLAVIPMQAPTQLKPGEDVNAGGIPIATPDSPFVGIVDPFLKQDVEIGQWFWLVIYPRQIDSLRHVWTHPAFPEEEAPVSLKQREESKKWLEKFIKEHAHHWDMAVGWEGKVVCNSIEDLVVIVNDYLENGTKVAGWCFANDEVSAKDFWDHYENYVGKKVVGEDDKNFEYFVECCA